VAHLQVPWPGPWPTPDGSAGVNARQDRDSSAAAWQSNGFVSTRPRTMSTNPHCPCPAREAREMGPAGGPCSCLVGVEEEEGNHEGEQAGSFGEGKAQDGVREKLACD
jgi:hypothetical protein